MDILEDQVQKTLPINKGVHKLQVRFVNCKTICWIKDFLAKNMNKQALMKLIANYM